MKCRELIEKLNGLAPEAFACEWDNSGLLAGRSDKEVKKLVIALDATDEVVELAVKEKADFLLTHHPLIFKPLKKINDENFISRRIVRLIQADISYYAMHTNFDAAPGCMADLASERLKLNHTRPLEVMGQDERSEKSVLYGIGKYGELSDPVTLKELAELVKRQFQIPYVTVYGAGGKESETVTRIAVCPGSGKSVIAAALEAGAEVFVTGDMGHHEGIDAAAQGMVIIDAGHYGLEHIFVDFMERYIRDCAGEELEIVKAPLEFPVICW